MHSLPPPLAPRHEYGPQPRHGVVSEAGGYVITCRCKWLRWEPSHKDAAELWTKHRKKCKAHQEAA